MLPTIYTFLKSIVQASRHLFGPALRPDRVVGMQKIASAFKRGKYPLRFGNVLPGIESYFSGVGIHKAELPSRGLVESRESWLCLDWCWESNVCHVRSWAAFPTVSIGRVVYLLALASGIFVYGQCL